MGKNIHVLFEEEEGKGFGSLYKGKIDKLRKDGTHHVLYVDGERAWERLEDSFVVWHNGLVTGEKSEWKEDTDNQPANTASVQHPSEGTEQVAVPIELNPQGAPRQTKSTGKKRTLPKINEKPANHEPQPKKSATQKLKGDKTVASEKPDNDNQPEPVQSLGEELTVDKLKVDELNGEKTKAISLSTDGVTAEEQPTVHGQQKPEKEPELRKPSNETKAEKTLVSEKPKTKDNEPGEESVGRKESEPHQTKPPSPTSQPPGDKIAGADKIKEPASKSSDRKRKEPEERGPKDQTGGALLKEKAKAGLVLASDSKGLPKASEPPSKRLAIPPSSVQKTSDEFRILRDRLDTNATAMMNALNALKTATSELSGTAEALSKLGSSKHTVTLARDTLLVRKLKGVIGFFCRPQEEAIANDKRPGIFETDEFGSATGGGLDALVLEPIMNLMTVANSWAEVEGKPVVPEGRAVRRARLEGSNQLCQTQAPTQAPAPAQKLEEDLSTEAFRSTGNGSRDDAIRVLAHALVTAATPVEAALEMELVLFTRYCLNDKSQGEEQGGVGAGASSEVNVEYLKKVKALWSALSPTSPQCRPLLRYMLLTGMITPSELVVITPDMLAAKEHAAKEQLLECKPGWLSDVLAAVNLNHRPSSKDDQDGKE